MFPERKLGQVIWKGLDGNLLRKDKRHRLMLGVRLIQQAAAVKIDVNDVVPV